MEQIDLVAANKIAAGANRESIRVVNGLGSLMKSREMTSVNFEESHNVDTLLEKDRLAKEKYKTQKHVSEQNWSLNNWYLRLNWLNLLLAIVIPLVGLFFALTDRVPLHFNVLMFSIIYYAVGGLSITAGYHRLWAHSSYSARWPLRLFFAIFGCASVQGSIKWWCHSHRVHHRYTDTRRDPYDARRGLWYSHMGWVVLQPNPKWSARADISDLLDDWIVRFQHRHFIFLMFLFAFIFPAALCSYLYGDFWGGLVYGGILRVFAIQQATFCINSLAHYLGTQPFDDRRTPTDNWLTALITFGEGYHNFHHEFPTDYRNAIKWYQYDPTKLVIYCASLIGLAHNLKKFSQNAIQQGLIQQKQKKLDRERAKLNWGTSLSELPVWDKSEFMEQTKQNSGLVVISGIVHDVSGYITEHPGGETLVQAALGKDATRAFNGGVYLHSNAAHNILATMRVAVVREGQDAASKFAARRGEIYDKKTI